MPKHPLQKYPSLLAVMLLFCTITGLGAQTRIGIVIDGPWERNQEVRELFESEITDLTTGEFKVLFPTEKRIVSNWTLAGVDSALNQLLTDPEVDIVLAMGVIASMRVCQRGELPKPVIAPFVIDVATQGVPLRDGKSGVRNLNYVHIPSTIERDLRAFLELIPFKKVAVLVNRALLEAVPDLLTNIQSITNKLDVTPVVLPVGRNTENIFAGMPDDVEAVYALPLLQPNRDDFDRLVQGLIERKLPSFAMLGPDEVRNGLMASINTDVLPRISRRVALNTQQILLGTEAGEIPVAFAAGQQLVINMSTVRAIGALIPFAALTEAEIVNPIRTQNDRVLTLESAVKEATRANPDLASKAREVSASRHTIGLTRANLLPQIDIGATALQIDADRAKASFGSQPRRRLSGTATLTQLIYSNDAWTRYNAQQQRQMAIEQELAQLRLDIAQQAATAYLQVLQAKTNERIERDNLQRTRANLDLARVREAVGFSGRADVYRWESEIAINRSRVIRANAQRNATEIQLNRLLNRPAEESFLTSETESEDIGILNELGPALPFLENQGKFRVLRNFMSQEGMRLSPELQQLDALIAAQQGILNGKNRALWAPTVALQAQVDNTFSRTSADLSLLAGAGLQPADDLNWNVALNLNFPLFTSGFKSADRQQAREQLSQLQLQRDAVADRIEQRIRSAFHFAGASFAAIKLSQAAATAAGQNLELIVDAYSNGLLAIIDLVDAQNAALVAEQSAANAVFAFLIDFMEAARAVGLSWYEMSDQDKFQLIQRLQNFESNAQR